VLSSMAWHVRKREREREREINTNIYIIIMFGLSFRNDWFYSKHFPIMFQLQQGHIFQQLRTKKWRRTSRTF
jgi:hypothetical protein